MITDNGKFSFEDVTLVSKTGRFMFEDRKNTKYVYEVSHNMFRDLLVIAANAKASGAERYTNVNTFDFLFNQLEMTEELFAATMYSYSDWISKEK